MNSLTFTFRYLIIALVPFPPTIHPPFYKQQGLDSVHLFLNSVTNNLFFLPFNIGGN